MKENYSAEHLSYLERERKKRLMIISVRTALLIFLIFIWQTAADKGWVNQVITSSPKKILICLSGLIKDKSLFNHIACTLFETVTGFVIATLAGILISAILWASENTAKVLDPYLVVLNALPKVALGPLIIVWAGAGIKSIIIMSLSISLISTVISVYSGFRSVDEETILLMRSFGAGKLQTLCYAVLPASCRAIMGALKINVSLSWVGVIMGEFLVSKAGIGYLIMYGSQVFNLDLVMSGIIVLCVLAGGMYLLISASEKYAVNKGWMA